MSGLPVNTLAQAKEYRKQYLANLALEAQNDAYNLMANQVYKQTKQILKPADTRSTTEKLADIEQLKVSVLNDLMQITDGQMALETVTDLTADELVFVAQMMPTIIAEIKPKFARGIPSQALLSYIRALRRRELATNGVSFTSQEATSQAILNALQAGRGAGAPLPPFAPQVQEPASPLPVERSTPPALEALPVERTPPPDRFAPIEIFPLRELPKEKQKPFSSLSDFYELSWLKIRDWYDNIVPIMPEISLFVPEDFKIRSGTNAGRLKAQPTVGVEEAKMMMIDAVEFYLQNEPMVKERRLGLKEAAQPSAPSPIPVPLAGNGISGNRQATARPLAPHSRFPIGRQILGYGLKKSPKVTLDMTKGVVNTAPTYVPFGKFIINPSKLSRGFFEVRTLMGGKIGKYPDKQLSPNLTKIMRRMIEDRMPDEYDFNEMDLEDQNFLFNLAKDAKINERLNIPTPKLSKEGEEMNKFEILKGQIIAGNDNRELVKEFKQMLLRFSNDGRIKKSEAREILLDLTALGY